MTRWPGPIQAEVKTSDLLWADCSDIQTMTWWIEKRRNIHPCAGLAEHGRAALLCPTEDSSAPSTSLSSPLKLGSHWLPQLPCLSNPNSMLKRPRGFQLNFCLRCFGICEVSLVPEQPPRDGNEDSLKLNWVLRWGISQFLVKFSEHSGHLGLQPCWALRPLLRSAQTPQDFSAAFSFV